MPTIADNVAKLYGKIAEHEATRLADHPMEREITLRTIRHWLAKSSASSSAPKRIADVGGGPGKLAFPLADDGHHVDLIDLTPDLIVLAEAEQKRRQETDGSDALLASLRVGNALDSTLLTDASYDAVLLLGPLYHLIEEDERKQAVDNALRLAKPGGVVFCAFISLEAHLRDIAVREPGRLLEEKSFYTKYLTNGRYEKANSTLGMPVQSFHTRSRDVKAFLDRHFASQAELVDLRSVEGILGGGLDAKLAESSDEVVQAWADMMFQSFSSDAAHLGCADHLLAVLRKK